MAEDFLTPLDEVDARVDEAGMKMMEKTNQEAWSALDAASEKLPPSERLTFKAMKAIQGFIDYPNALSD